MDIMMIKMLDIVTNENEETGKVTTQRLYLPTIMQKKDIEDISPCVTKLGVLYKNMSIITKYTGESYTVVGNYKKLTNIINNKDIKKIGF